MLCRPSGVRHGQARDGLGVRQGAIHRLLIGRFQRQGKQLDEFIELFTLPLETAYQEAMNGALPDAKTIAGLAMAHARWTAEHTKGE